jgi:hypothetical protein
MIEPENGHRTVDIQRDVLELHLFPRELVPALFRLAVHLEAIFDFSGGLVHGRY